MKYTVFLFLLFFSFVSFAKGSKTLLVDELSGTWQPAREYFEKPPAITEMKPAEIALNIKSPRQVILKKYYNGEAEVLKTSGFKQVGNLFYWKFVRDENFYCELILGGWQLRRDGDSKILFGYLYLVSRENGLFNGWSVSLHPESASKARQ